MKKPLRKSEILRQFLSDSLLIDETVLLPDYNFADSCLMTPFYLLVQAIKALNSDDLYFAESVYEELTTFKVPFLSQRLVSALLHIEKNETDAARKELDELEDAYFKRSTPNRYYLRALDAVYTADYRLFKKWYPLVMLKCLIFTDLPYGNHPQLRKYTELAVEAGVEPVWAERFELISRLSYYQKSRDYAAQEELVTERYHNFEEGISCLNIHSNAQAQYIRTQTVFLIQLICRLIEQYDADQNYNRALHWCDRILMLQPRNQKALITKIEIMKKMKRYRCSLGFCNSFIANTPDDSVGYYLRSNTYFLMNENAKALQDAQDCYNLSRDKKMGLLARGFSLLNLEEYEKAAGCFEAVCSMGNPSYEALRGLGKAYASTGNTLKALECYMQCRRMDPVDLDLLYDIADTQFMGGYFEEAKKSCFACIKENPHFTGAYVILGMITLREGKQSLAMKYFDKTLQMDSKNPYALNEKGFLCHLSGEEEKAKELIEQALQEFPEYADALCNKGIILFTANEYDEAIRYFDRALEISPEHMGAALGKANVFIQENRFEEAAAVYELILEMDPYNEAARAGLDTIDRLTGVAREPDDDSSYFD